VIYNDDVFVEQYILGHSSNGSNCVDLAGFPLETWDLQFLDFTPPTSLFAYGGLCDISGDQRGFVLGYAATTYRSGQFCDGDNLCDYDFAFVVYPQLDFSDSSTTSTDTTTTTTSMTTTSTTTTTAP
jgi:hypothetical protein